MFSCEKRLYTNYSEHVVDSGKSLLLQFIVNQVSIEYWLSKGKASSSAK